MLENNEIKSYNGISLSTDMPMKLNITKQALEEVVSFTISLTF
jgi:hypothetical protein